MFSTIIGNDHIKEYLTRLIGKQRFGHLLLFAGPEGVGKTLFAEEFAKRVLTLDDPQGRHLYKLNAGTHPDLHIYRPEGKIGMHSIAAMRALSEEVYLPPYEAARKVFIIQDADRMLSYSANALLKTFEEPAPETLIILVSSSPEQLLPTILSRCSTFHFHALSTSELVQLLTTQKNLPAEEAQRIARLAQGSAGRADRLSRQTEDPLRQAVLKMLALGRFESYSALLAKVKELADFMESSTKNAEAASKEELLKGYCDKLSAVQRESLEKEIEGVAAMRLQREAEAFFDLLLAWHRDLHLLSVKGDHKLLLLPDYLKELQQALSANPKLLPLETLFEAIKTAKLALARSTGLALCLENLYLRLNML